MPGRYAPGDSGYATLNAKWVSEGSPSGQFEELGDFGGRRWQVVFQDDAADPTFLLIAAAGPTSTGYDEDTGTFKDPEWTGPSSGYAYENAAEVGLEFRQGSGGDNDLEIHYAPPTRDPEV
jgi:hypothetical protein